MEEPTQPVGVHGLQGRLERALGPKRVLIAGPPRGRRLWTTFRNLCPLESRARGGCPPCTPSQALTGCRPCG